MSSVDNRTVNMNFNGGSFLSGVQSAIGALNKLDDALNLTGKNNGLDKIGDAAKKVDLSSLENNVEGIRGRLSALGIAGAAVIADISTRAVHAGANFIKSFTLDPAIGGFNEMELKMKSVQTILANTGSRFGTNVDDVTGALDELNHYADKTIYNFAEMTQNIGRFTTAGLDLNTSVTGIKGIANLGAFFNASSQDVNRGMYQMSQALANGTIRLMDWNSMVNANMAGPEFTDDLIRTAKKLKGIDVNAMIADKGSFRETLQEGWLTNDIFLESLKHFSTDVDEIGEGIYRSQLAAEGWSEAEIDKIVYLGRTATEAATKVRSWTQLWDTLSEEAGSGWAETWETVFGNFEESTELFNGAYHMLNPIVSGMNDWRNNLLEGWKNLGGRDSLISTITTVGENAIGLWDMITGAADRAFDISPQGLYDATTALGDFVDSLQLSGDAIRDAEDTFEGFFSAFDIVGQVLGFAAGAAGELFSALFPLVDGFLDITGALGGGISGFDEWLKSSEIFSHGLEGLHDLLAPVKDFTKGLSDGIGEGIRAFTGEGNDLFGAITGFFTGATNEVDKGGQQLQGAGTGVGTIMQDVATGVGNSVTEFANPIKDGITSFFDNIGNAFNLENDPTAVGQKLGEGFRGFTAGFKIAGEQSGPLTSISEDVGGAMSGVASMLGNIPWGDILAVVGIFGTALAFKQLANTFSQAKKTMSGIGGAIESFKGVMDNIGLAAKSAGKMMKMQGLSSLITAIGIVVAAIAALTFVEGLNPGSLQRVLGPLALLILEIAGIAEAMGAIPLNAAGVSRATAMAGVIQSLAVTLVIIAGAIALLGDIDSGQMQNAAVVLGSLGAVIALLGTLMTSSLNISGDKASFSTGSTSGLFRKVLMILAIAKAIEMMAETVAGLSSYDPGAIQNGLNVVMQLMGSLALMMGAMSLMSSSITTKGGGSFKGGTGSFTQILSMLAMVESIRQLADVAKSFAYMDPGSINKGLSAIGLIASGLVGAIAALSLLSKYVGGVKISSLASLIVITDSLASLADTVGQLASIPDVGGSIGALTALAAVITIVVGIMSTLNNGLLKSVGQAIVMGAFADTLMTMVEVLSQVSAMSDNLDIGGVMLSIGMLIALVGAMKLMAMASQDASFWSLVGLAGVITSLTEALSTLSGLSLEGVATALIAIGGAMIIMGAGAAALGGMTWQLIGIAAAFTLFSLGANLFASAMFLIVQSLNMLANVTGPALANLTMAIPQIITSITEGIMDAVEAVSRRSGELVPALINIINNALKGIGGASLQLAETFVKLILDGINMIAQYAPQLVDAIVTMLCNIFDSVASNAGRIVGSIKNLFDAIGKALTDAFGDIQIDPGAVDHVVQTMYEVAGLLVIMKFLHVGIGDAIKVAAELILVFGPMAALFALISMVADQDAVQALDKINEAILIIASVCAVFSVIPFSGAITACAGLDTFIANLTVVLAALGALKQIPGLEWLISEGGDFLGTLGEAIGKFIGGIGGGIAEQFSNSFGPIGQNLAEFTKSASPFFDMIQGLDANTSDKLTSFTDLLTALSDMGGTVKFGTDKLKNLSEYLPGLAEALVSFNNQTKDINPDQLASVSGFLTSIGTVMESLPDKVAGTNTDNVFGKMTLSQFGDELSDFATDVRDMVDKIGPGDGLDLSGVEAVIGVANELNTLQQSLPEINDGSSAWFSGTTQTLNSFSTGITDFATAMDDFRTKFPSANGLDLTGIDSVIEIAKKLVQVQVDLANATKTETGWLNWQEFLGLGEFGNQISIFADNLRGKDLSFKEFGEEGDYSPARARNLVSLISGLAEAQATLGSVKLESGWGGSEKIQYIGGLAKDIADHITDFTTLAEGIGGMNIDDSVAAKFTQFGTCLQALAGVQNKLAEFSGDDTTISGQTLSLGTFVKDLAGEGSTFMTDMQTLINGSNEFNPDGLTNLNTACINLKTLAVTLSGIDPDQMTNIDGFIGALQQIKSIFSGNSELSSIGGTDFTQVAANIQAVAGVIPELVSAFSGLQGTTEGGDMTLGGGIEGFITSLEKLLNFDFGTALTNLQTSVEGMKTSMTGLVDSLGATFDQKAEEFKAKGKAMGDALIEGLNSASQDTSQLESLATNAINALGNKEGEFKSKGEAAGQNYVDGVSSKAGPAADAASQMASGAAAAAEGGYDAFYSAGANAAQGYVDGIASKLADARAKAAELAAVAAGATNKAQESNSPSKLFMRIGAYAGQGYALGISDQYDYVETTAKTMIANALGAAYDLSQKEMDVNPVIAPVIDTTGMEPGFKMAEAMLGRLESTSLATAMNLSGAIGNRFAEAESVPATLVGDETGMERQIVYNQTINSPKAISRLDVYRDTKSLLARTKEAAIR